MEHTETVVAHIRQFNRFYTALIGTLNRNFLGFEYSVTETRILFEIYSNPQCSAKTIAAGLQIDKSYMSRIIKSFEAKGLISKLISSQDRRVSVITLTPKGEQETRKLISATNAQISELISNLNEAECQKVCAAMDLITAYFSK